MPRILDMLASMDERSHVASEYAMERQKDRIAARTEDGKDADGRSFALRKDGKRPKVAGKGLLSTLSVRTFASPEGSESTLGSSGSASTILGSQNRMRGFFGFGDEDRSRVMTDYVGKLLGR